MTTTCSPDSLPQPDTAPIRLHYLDGIRGLAALYVTLHHAYLQVTWQSVQTLPALVQAGTKWLEYGSFSVAAFIVLSGYCLMIPVAKTGSLRDGFWGYIKRRSLRILPPYYIAIAFALCLTAAFPLLQQSETGTIWNVTQPAFKLDAILPHMVIIHNFKGDWAGRINYPLWSVATEWQIYFFLPLLLIPLWRRYGITVTVLAATAIGFIPPLFVQAIYGRKPWYLTLFTLGVAAAAIGFSQDSAAIRLRKSVPWGKLALGLSTGLVVLAAPQSRYWLDHHEIITDPIVGCIIACVLIQCTEKIVQHETMPLLHLFNHRWMVVLGTFSYSLYLIHAPILAAIDLPLQAWNVSPLVRLAIGLGIATPLSIALSYPFYLLFERRFVSGYRKQK